MLGMTLRYFFILLSSICFITFSIVFSSFTWAQSEIKNAKDSALITSTKDKGEETVYEYFVHLGVERLAFSQTDEGWFFEGDHYLSQLFNQYQVSLFEPAFPSASNRILKQTYLLRTHSSALTPILTNHFSHLFSLIEPVPILKPLYTPNDYFAQVAPASNYWHLDMVTATDAWDITKGDNNVFTLIVEPPNSFFDEQHEDMQDKFIGIHLGIGGVQPSNYHGTSVAHMAAGGTDNHKGMAAIGFNTRLYGFELGNGTHYNKLLTLSEQGMRIMNFSYVQQDSQGNPATSFTIDVLMAEIHLNGTILVAGAGNEKDNSHLYQYPASYLDVLSVTAVGPTESHVRDDGSTYTHNDRVDLTAPGYKVPYTDSRDHYATGWGTSFSSPMVAGTVALMLSANGCLSPDDVKHILTTTAKNIDNHPDNQPYQGLLGAGIVQAGAAVAMAENFQSTTYTPLPLNSGVEVRHYCDAQLNEKMEVSGLENPIYTQHQFNLHRQSDDSLVEVIAGSQVSPHGYTQGPFEFTTPLVAHEQLYIKRGVWDACTTWQETRKAIVIPSCVDQQNYRLEPKYAHASVCASGYTLAGDNIAAIDRVKFTYLLSGQTPAGQTQVVWDNHASFEYDLPIIQPAATITADIYFNSGKTKTLSLQKPLCNALQLD